MFSDDITKKIAAAAAQIKTEPPKNEVNTKSVEGAVVSIMANEELKGNQHKIDANKNGKIDAHDFKLLRGKKKVEEGVKGAGVGAALGSVAGGPVGAAIGGALGHVAGEVLSSAKNKAKAMGRVAVGPSMADSKLKKEETELDEGFPTVADAKKRMASKESPFEKKKISTGTVYTRKYKEEPDEDLKSPSRRARDSAAVLGKGEHMPKKKAKTMKEMLDIYKQHGAESLIENLLIEEPTQDEYKKEVEVAQAKADGKIRNDKGVAKPASQGVKMEEVEQIDELVGKGKLPSIAAYHKQKSAEAKGKMETVRSSNTKLPVPKATSAKIFAKDAEAKYHSTQAKRADALMKKEEVENIGEASTYKLGRAAAETKDFPIHHNGEHVGKLEFHTSAGKLHHRVSSIKGVPHEKFIGHPDREKMTNAHVAKHEAEARKHFAKKLKEEVEIEMYDADEINNVQINNIDERSLTSAEMNKREEIVKSMKKGIQGFKDRYGDRAKEVMYATATKQAKKD